MDLKIAIHFHREKRMNCTLLKSFLHKINAITPLRNSPITKHIKHTFFVLFSDALNVAFNCHCLMLLYSIPH